MGKVEPHPSLLSRLDPAAQWMSGDGEHSAVVLTCRVRLARNLAALRFPNRCTESELRSIAHHLLEVVAASPVFAGFELLDLTELSELERFALVERYLCSRQLAQAPAGRALVFNRAGSISVMINEEDHLRIQCLYSGLQLETAARVALEVETSLAHELSFAFSERWGYLTACPTNVGTGLRASAMLHLPALTEQDRLNDIVNAAGNAGFTVRGLYGEGSEARGSLHQFSHQVTLGKSEDDLVAALADTCTQIATAELQARRQARTSQPVLLEERVARSYATLRYARQISSEEALEALSWLRWGLEERLLTGLDRPALNELMIRIRPGLQQMLAARRLPVEERDRLRAELLRKRLQSVALADRLQ